MKIIAQILLWLGLLNGRTLDKIIGNLSALDAELEAFEKRAFDNALGVERQISLLDAKSTALRNEAERAYRVRSKVAALIE